MDPSSFSNNNINPQNVTAAPTGTGEVTVQQLQQQPQQQQQQAVVPPQLALPNMGAATAVQQALAAFQASVEAAAAAAVAAGPPAPQASAAQQAQFAPAPFVATTPAAPGLTQAATPNADAQQLWQQAWLSAILPAQQAALTQPYLAAALNPLQAQPQQQQPQQQQIPFTTLPPAPTPAAQPPPPAPAVATERPATNKRKAVVVATPQDHEPPLKQQQHGSSTTVISTTSKDTMFDAQPPAPKSEAELAHLTPTERRRYERNLREQQRSYKISQQIKQLRDVLHESNIPFRPNKYSILVSVADYIQQLQSRAIMLDSEHQRLLDTLRQTSERLESGGLLHTTTTTATSTTPHTTTVLDADTPIVAGIDYQAVFLHCCFPLAVATLDGRVLQCNSAMQVLLGCGGGGADDEDGTNTSMVDQSFFVFIRNHQEVFEAMAALLKRSTATIETGEGTVTPPGHLLFWCGHVRAPSNETFPFTITLTNDASDNPKYFSLSAAATATPDMG